MSHPAIRTDYGIGRTDYGRPRLTARDTLALEWLAQQYGAPQDVLARLLDTTMQRSYAVISRWRRLGGVDTGGVDAGPRWVWPTAEAATEWLGWPAGPWRPRASGAAQLRATAEVRLALCGRTLTGWTSWRVLRHELAGDANPACDGIAQAAGRTVRVRVWTDPDETTTGQVADNLASLAPSQAAPVLYVVTDTTAGTVEAATERAEQHHDIPAGTVGRIDLDHLTGAEPGAGWAQTDWLAHQNPTT